MWEDYNRDRYDEGCDEMFRGGTPVAAGEDAEDAARSVFGQSEDSEVVSEKFDYDLYSRLSNSSDATRHDVDRVDGSLHSNEQNETDVENNGVHKLFHSFDQGEYPLHMDCGVYSQESAAGQSSAESVDSRNYFAPNALLYPITETYDDEDSIASGFEIDAWSQSLGQRAYSAKFENLQECREMKIMDSSRNCEPLFDTAIPAKSFVQTLSGVATNFIEDDTGFGSPLCPLLRLPGKRAAEPERARNRSDLVLFALQARRAHLQSARGSSLEATTQRWRAEPRARGPRAVRPRSSTFT